MSQVKEQDKTSEKELSKTEISKLPDIEFNITVIEMLTELGRGMDEHSENSSKENIKKEWIRAKEYNN